jgi:hypothetical protein
MKPASTEKENAMSDEVHPDEPLDSAKSRSAAVIPHASFSQAMEEFDRAWRHPQHTPIELEPLDVNAMLQQDYILSEPVRLTCSLLWDAEAKKAWDPRPYIPHVVRAGQSWGRTTLTGGTNGSSGRASNVRGRHTPTGRFWKRST